MQQGRHDEERGALVSLHTREIKQCSSVCCWSNMAPSGKEGRIRCHVEDEERDIHAANV